MGGGGEGETNSFNNLGTLELAIIIIQHMGCMYKH